MQSPENSVVLSPSLGFCQMEISDKLAEQSVKVGIPIVFSPMAPIQQEK